LIDPEVIVLGGGVIEACSEFMMPIVENIVGSDRLPGARDGGQVLLSALGDDAVVLGAVALARKRAGRSPFKKRFSVAPRYPQIVRAGGGKITVGRKTYGRDVFIGVNGKVKKRGKSHSTQHDGSTAAVHPKELRKVCRGGPEVLFLGAGQQGKMELTAEAERYLGQRAIRCEMLPTAAAAEAYNRSKQRKAALMHVT
jgi:glucokinase